jgi:hypothetical protein
MEGIYGSKGNAFYCRPNVVIKSEIEKERIYDTSIKKYVFKKTLRLIKNKKKIIINVY